MKKSENAKSFPLQFSKTIHVLCAAVLVLCAVAIGVSIWRIVTFGIHEFTDVIKYPFLIAVCIFAVLLVISVLSKSEYVVQDGNLWLNYGFITSKFSVKDVTSIVQDTDCKKLSVYFGEQFIVVTVREEWFEKFVRALLAENPNIDYSFTLTDTPDAP